MNQSSGTPPDRADAPDIAGGNQAYHLDRSPTTGDDVTSTSESLSQCRWRSSGHPRRCAVIGSVRHAIAAAADDLVALCRSPQRVDDLETVASELIPLCEALQWIGCRGAKTLADRRVGLAGRPLWMWGVRSVVRRRAVGRVLVLGTWNYPLLLSGVQMAQALAAGNHVTIKPAPGSEPATALLVDCFRRTLVDAGFDADRIELLDSSRESGQSAIERGPDLIVLTGSAATGRHVQRQAADHTAACIMELSGADAVVALPSAVGDSKPAERMLDCLEFGLMFNSGATCIGPRRWFLPRHDTVGNDSGDQHDVTRRLVDRLKLVSPVTVHPAARESVAAAIESAIGAGAIDLVGCFDAVPIRQTGRMMPVVLDHVAPGDAIGRSDLFAPVISIVRYDSMEDVVAEINANPYRLAASVFGDSAAAADVAEQLEVGTVTVNDLIAPTADPRLPFGGRGASGFGVTRGPEGLVAMTTAHTVIVRRGNWLPHLSPRNDSSSDLLLGVLKWQHGRTWRQRLASLRRITTAARGPR